MPRSLSCSLLRDSVIRKEQYLTLALRYVHINPPSITPSCEYHAQHMWPRQMALPQNIAPCAPPQRATSTNASSVQHKHETHRSIGKRLSNDELLRGEPIGSSGAPLLLGAVVTMSTTTSRGCAGGHSVTVDSSGSDSRIGGAFCRASISKISGSSSPATGMSSGACVASPFGCSRFSFEPVRR